MIGARKHRVRREMACLFSGALSIFCVELTVEGTRAAPPEGMVIISGGEFEMGDHHDNMGWCLPIHTVTLDAFSMDRHEVTNQRYAEGLNWALAQGLIYVGGDNVVYGSGNSLAYCDTTTSSSFSRITWNANTFGVVGQELPSGDPGNKTNHPMVRVSWFGAAAYSNWRSAMQGGTPSYDTSTWACNFSANGYRLPSEAEWEYAARGNRQCENGPPIAPEDHYCRYHCGNNIDGSKANYWNSADPYETGDYPWTTPLGYYAANGYGLYDIAGNVWEWCNDWYADYPSQPLTNPRGPENGQFGRVVRGGAWDAQDYDLRCAIRSYVMPADRVGFAGFRLGSSANGACCLVNGTCQNLFDHQCSAQNGAFHGRGSTCDADRDADYIADLCDNCPSASNPGQSDLDNDGIGDACDPCTLVNDVCIPTLSEWGMVAMAALMLTAGAVVVSRRRAVR
ncbi:MAG: IPTL-CTERM sorting domain-containing protein [Planctomycetota bacterium]